MRSIFVVVLVLAHAAGAEPSEPPEPADAPVIPVGEVSITAARSERSVLEVPGNVTVIDREEIDRSGAATLPALLRRQPGLFVTGTTTNPAGVQVEARGFNNGGALGSSLLVQVDGRRVNQADTGNTDWALIPLDAIESIEIVRGPASALYGDNAVGGVIDIRTLPGEGPFRATLRGRGGSYSTGEGSLNAAGTIGVVTGSLFVEGLSTDGYRDGSAFDREEVKADVEVTLGPSWLLGLSGGWAHNLRELPGTLTRRYDENGGIVPGSDQIAALGRRARQPGTEENRDDVHAGFVFGRLEGVLAEDVELRVESYYRPRSDDALISVRFLCAPEGEEPFEVISDFATDTSQESIGATGLLQIDRSLLGLRNRLITGFDFLHEHVDRIQTSSDSCFGTDTTPSDLSRDIYAGFLQDELSLTENLLLSAGVRFDRVELDLAIADAVDDPTFDIWSPKVALVWRALPSVSIYGSYSRGFRLPNFDEDVPLLFEPPFPLIPDLEAQVSNAFEIGAKLVSDRLTASLALYQMNVENEIFLDPFAGFVGLNQNFDRVRHRGIEVAVSGQMMSWLSAWGSYTFDSVEIRDAENRDFVGRRVPITPRNRGSLGLFVDLPYDVELTAAANLVGSRKVSNVFFVTPGGPRIPKLDPYATLDLMLAWRPRLSERFRAAITFAVRNATGEKYDDFAAASTFNPGVVGFNPAATRTWEVGLVLGWAQ